VFIDPDDNITIKGPVFRGTEGPWELLTRKNLNTQLVGKEDLKTNKKVLILTNAHLTRYEPGDNINITQGKNFAMSLRPALRNRRDGVSNQR